MINQGILKIAMELSDPTDYSAFVIACESVGKEPISVGEYAQKIGMVLVGVRMFPTDTPEAAYMKLVEIMNSNYKLRNLDSIGKTLEVKKGCNSCGGGKVL